MCYHFPRGFSITVTLQDHPWSRSWWRGEVTGNDAGQDTRCRAHSGWWQSSACCPAASSLSPHCCIYYFFLSHPLFWDETDFPVSMVTLPLSSHFFKEVFICFFRKLLFLALASPAPPPHPLLSAQAFLNEQNPPRLSPSSHEGCTAGAGAVQNRGPNHGTSLHLCLIPLGSVRKKRESFCSAERPQEHLQSPSL